MFAALRTRFWHHSLEYREVLRRPPSPKRLWYVPEKDFGVQEDTGRRQKESVGELNPMLRDGVDLDRGRGPPRENVAQAAVSRGPPRARCMYCARRRSKARGMSQSRAGCRTKQERQWRHGGGR